MFLSHPVELLLRVVNEQETDVHTAAFASRVKVGNSLRIRTMSFFSSFSLYSAQASIWHIENIQ